MLPGETVPDRGTVPVPKLPFEVALDASGKVAFHVALVALGSGAVALAAGRVAFHVALLQSISVKVGMLAE